MKKILLGTIILCITFSLIRSSLPVYAQNEASGSSDTKTKQIEDLKERLATKVAQLHMSERRAMMGLVKSTSITSLVVETKVKDLKIELTDNIKVFQIIKGKRTSLSTEDIDKGDTVVIFGDYDASLDLMKAKVIFIQNQSEIRLTGIVEQSDKKEYTITVKNATDQQFIIDFETTTKAFEWTEPATIGKSGFSKIVPGSIISVLGSLVPNKENRISAARIFIVNLNIKPSPTPTVTPTGVEKNTGIATPSGQKVQKPTGKLSPTPIP